MAYDLIVGSTTAKNTNFVLNRIPLPVAHAEPPRPAEVIHLLVMEMSLG